MATATIQTKIWGSSSSRDKELRSIPTILIEHNLDWQHSIWGLNPRNDCDDCNKDQRSCNYENWDDEAVQPKITEGSVLMEKKHKKTKGGRISNAGASHGRTSARPTLHWSSKIRRTPERTVPIRLWWYTGSTVAHRWRVRAVCPDIIKRTINVPSAVSEFCEPPTGKTNKRHNATTFLLASYGKWRSHYCQISPIMSKKRCTNKTTEETTAVPTGQTISVLGDGYTGSTFKDDG